MSLGGLHDEAELRGHRRTYIGAMPGRVIQAMRRAGANNPVLMLDEVDKLGRDFRGDPAHALLEILDPEQNKTFRDNYLDLPFDLSKVLFVTTANALDTIPRPLLDRMEILRLAGYSEEEKLEIAQALSDSETAQRNRADGGAVRPSATTRVRKIISGYTREAGLRRLERAIGRVMRKVALQFAEGATRIAARSRPTIWPRCWGRRPFTQEEARRELPPGVATGLAWTETGGDVLYIEGTLLPDGKGLTLTGQLGEVMQESAKAAQSYIWSHAGELRHRPGAVQELRRARSRSGGRDPERRTVGGRDHGDGADLALYQAAGAQRRGDDRRDHADRTGAAHRRHQGESAGRAAGRNPIP